MPQKFALVIPDGAADEPVGSLGGRTPLGAARIPEMDRIAREGVLGRSRNVPDRFLPGSDVATLSLLGYDPEAVFTGRAPLEAAAAGVALGADDWAVRCNLMTIEGGRLTDFTAGHISSEEARILIDVLQTRLGQPPIEFHPGVQYRNLMIYRGQGRPAPFGDDTSTTPAPRPRRRPGRRPPARRPGRGAAPPADGRGVGPDPRPPGQPRPDRRGQAARQRGLALGPGQGARLPKFQVVHGLKGAIVSAVDLVRGAAMLAGWTRVDAPGATGYLDTDYAAKGRAAIAALADHDIVCVHVEAPDEASHEGRADAKVEALERIDARSSARSAAPSTTGAGGSWSRPTTPP